MTREEFNDRVGCFIASQHLLENGKPVLAAVSGGADSVSLLMALMSLGFECVVAHCNFGLRGTESDRDEQFVRQLCSRLRVPLEVRHFDVAAYATEHGVSTEMACRDLRYAWFQKLAEGHDCQAIAVAHHRDDNVETFMLNALRGTGIAGLRGMRPRGNQPVPVVRPLLCVSRSEIIDYLQACGEAYVTDSSNLVADVKRNRLRNVVLPVVRQQFADADARLADTLAHVADDETLLAELARHATDGLITTCSDGFDLDLKGLFGFVNCASLLFTVLKPCGFSHEQCEQIVRATQDGNGSGKQWFSSTHALCINRGKLEVFVLKEQLECSHAINLSNNEILKPIKIGINHVTDSKFDAQLCDGRTKIALDPAVLNCHKVELRHWRDDDRFSPFGMRGTKLVSDLFTGLKLGEREKREAWLMVGDGKILWVVGHRASRHFAVPKDATHYLLLTLEQ